MIWKYTSEIECCKCKSPLYIAVITMNEIEEFFNSLILQYCKKTSFTMIFGSNLKN